jgi:acetyl-CoA carboxylase/biotin carboxylase 1
VIRKVLIANNGMASLKTIMSIRQWAYKEFGDERIIQFIVMATPDDLAANAEFIRRADDFIEVPGGSNANNYANVQLIADLAVSQNVDAVMVGWGHASENPKLPDMLSALSKSLGREITFVGPTAPVMRVLGDKIGSTLLAQEASVSTMPWNGDGLGAQLNERGEIPQDIFDAACIKSEAEALEQAARIGYPVMLKASEGGGGKGIRKASTEDELRAAYPQVVNEVPGSPVFLMKLCTQARHLEVQIIGDEHGNAIALSGRDCSTQRRHQKIFEEGPPTICPPAIFREMERAAVRLCKDIGYRSAGTVEYLFNAETGNYFFLELNPRLQVEHPVTEGLTGVSLPATQLQVAMGIPLNQLPEVRAYYGKAPYAIDNTLDLATAEPMPITKHVIAARITAENPDEGFKPTSGRIDRINFQSAGNVWGYFSVTANGGVHEYADSQFGHLFATGPTREDARKSLVLALKELFIHGEIRTTVEYLTQLLETDTFKDNTLDTAWLDGLIASRSIGVKTDAADVVTCATIVRAFRKIAAAEADFLSALEKGQFSTAPLRDVVRFGLETTHESVRYVYEVTRTAPDTLLLTLNGAETTVKVRQMADGSLLVMYVGLTHQVFATEEPLGLRMVLDGVTVLLPKAYDPSELRTDITGKVVRYLVPDGGAVGPTSRSRR